MKQTYEELEEIVKELATKYEENAKLAAKQIIAELEITSLIEEKKKRAAELIIANIELDFQNEEKAKRAAELIIANIELAFQVEEKAKRAEELIITNIVTAFQNEAMVNREAVLILANKELNASNNSTLIMMEDVMVAKNELETANKALAKEIEERKRAETMLRDEQKRISTILATVGDPIFVKDNDSRFVLANRAFYDMMGMEEKDLLGKTLGETLPAEEMEHFLAVDRRVLDTGISELCEEVLTSKDSIQRTIVTRKTRFFDDSGKGFLVGAMHDITERKQAEEKLRESENRFRLLFQNVNFANSVYEVISDKNGKPCDYRFLEVNSVFEENTGKKATELIGKTLLELFPQTENYWLEKFEQVFMTGIPIRFEEYSKELDTQLELNIYSPEKGQIAWSSIDITERKQAEELLLENNFRIELAMKSANMAWWEMDIPTGAVKFDKRKAEMLGYPPEQFKHYKDFMALVHPDDNDKAMNAMRDHFEGFCDKYEIEYRILTKTGNYRWFYDVGSITKKDQDGKPLKVGGLVLNITERKQAEERLLEQNQNLEQQYEEYMQLNEVLRVTNLELEKAKEKAENNEFLIKKQYQEQKLLVEKTKITSLLLQSSIESPKDMIILSIDKNYNYLFFNECHKASMLYAYGKDVKIGMNLLECITSEDDRIKAKINYDKALSGESHITVQEFGDIDKSYYETRYNPIFNDKNEVIGATAFSADVTERIKAKELLIEQNQQLEQQYEEYMQLNEVLRITNYDLEKEKKKAEESDKLKSAFLQNMSHEIRTPLNGIIGFTTLLRDEDITKEDIAEYTDVIQQSGIRLIEIVNNVLDMSKIETGQVEVQNSSFSLNSLISNLLNFFTPQANLKGVMLEYKRLKENEDSIMFSDESKLFQILSNLINNAIKFTNKGRVEFGFCFKNNMMEFYIKDTGIGIPDSAQSRIFARFAQVNLSITRDYEGAGLGLSICKGLVEILGGKIWFESEINIGTTFYFVLPANSIEKSDNLPITKTKQKNENKKITILIAEDDFASFEYLNIMLTKFGHTIIHAMNGEIAVELVKSHPEINLVLMDVKMPIMNGIEATKLIKQLRPELPIIAQTAFAFSKERESILTLGCDDYLAKPLQRAVILDMIEKYSLERLG